MGLRAFPLHADPRVDGACEKLLDGSSSSSSPSSSSKLAPVVEAYRQMLWRADPLISTAELEAMLTTGEFFSLQELGPSQKTHLVTGLRRIKQAFQSLSESIRATLRPFFELEIKALLDHRKSLVANHSSTRQLRRTSDGEEILFNLGKSNFYHHIVGVDREKGRLIFSDGNRWYVINGSGPAKSLERRDFHASEQMTFQYGPGALLIPQGPGSPDFIAVSHRNSLSLWGRSTGMFIRHVLIRETTRFATLVNAMERGGRSVALFTSTFDGKYELVFVNLEVVDGVVNPEVHLIPTPTLAVAIQFIDGTPLALILRQNGAVELWDASKGALERTIRPSANDSHLIPCGISPDGKVVLDLLFPDTLRASNLVTGEEIRRFPIQVPVLNPITVWSADGRFAAVYHQAEHNPVHVTVVDFANGRQSTVDFPPRSRVFFTPDDQSIGASSPDGKLRAYRLDWLL